MPFKALPAAYLGLCWLCAFLFELPIDFSLFGCLFFSWLYMRLFMVTKSTPPNQIGDSTPAFALSTFFPERCAPWLDWLTKVSYKVANMCKLVDGLQSCLKKRQIAKAKAKAENRKKALKMLQNEISKKDDEEEDEESGFRKEKTEDDDDAEEVKQVNTLLKSTDGGEDAKTSSAEDWKRRSKLATLDLVTKPKKESKSDDNADISEAVVKDEVDDDEEDGDDFEEVEI